MKAGTMGRCERLLITLRHSGPADVVATALPALAEHFEVVILATDAAAALLADRHWTALPRRHVRLFIPTEQIVLGHKDAPGALAQGADGGFREVNLHAPAPALRQAGTLSATQLSIEDCAGAERLAERLRSFVAAIQPGRFLRTTPAHCLGVDELAPAVLRTAGYTEAVLCLQDYYGVGVAMRDYEHPLAWAGVDAVATVDSNAAALVRERTGLEPYIIGWVGHEQYLNGPRYPLVRQEARAALGLASGDKLILYACIHSDLPGDNDLKDFEQALHAVAAIRPQVPALRYTFKVHPRTGPDDAQRYAALAASFADRITLVNTNVFTSFRHFLAAPDLIVSAASALNLDALAYMSAHASLGSISPTESTMSLYTTGVYAQRAMRQLTGQALLPTHRRDSASFTAAYDQLSAVLLEALLHKSSRSEVLRQVFQIYRPDGSAIQRLVQFILQRNGPV